MPLLHASITSPSGHKRWAESAGGCAGSVRMSQGYARSSTQAADDGTCEHALAEHCLIWDADPAAFADMEMVIYSAGDDEGVDFRDNMPKLGTVKHAQLIDDGVIDRVRNYTTTIAKYAAQAVWFAPETQVSIAEIVEVPEQFGTSDAIMLVPYIDVFGDDSAAPGYELQVHDYKSGRMYVPATKNGQGLLYWWGAYQKLADKWNIVAGRVVIHQPRISRKPDEWGFDLATARAFREGVHTDAQKVYRLMSAPMSDVIEALRPSEEACMFCPAAAECPALAAEAVTAALGIAPSAAGFEAITDHLPTDSQSILERVYPKLDLIARFVDKARERINQIVLGGLPFKGAKVVLAARGGRRSWSDETRTTPILVETLGEAAYLPRKVISPTKAEALLKKQYPDVWGSMQDAIFKPPKGHVVVPSDHPGEAVDLSARAGLVDDDPFAT